MLAAIVRWVITACGWLLLDHVTTGSSMWVQRILRSFNIPAVVRLKLYEMLHKMKDVGYRPECDIPIWNSRMTLTGSDPELVILEGREGRGHPCL